MPHLHPGANSTPPPPPHGPKGRARGRLFAVPGADLVGAHTAASDSGHPVGVRVIRATARLWCAGGGGGHGPTTLSFAFLE